MKKFRMFFILTAAFAICLTVNPFKAADTARAAAPIISWGLTHNTKEATPEPPKGSEKMLKENNGFITATQVTAAGESANAQLLGAVSKGF